MPWEETCTMSERMKFIAAYETGEETMTVLCQRFSISRKTGYKWLRRFQQEGIDGLHNKSRAHYSHPATTNEETVQWLLDLKQRYPHWGPNKIHDYLTLEQPEERWPSASTMGDILKKICHRLLDQSKPALRLYYIVIFPANATPPPPQWRFNVCNIRTAMISNRPT